MKKNGLKLALPPGTITFDSVIGSLIIDLVFMSNQLIKEIIQCRVKTLIDHDSDHYSVLIVLDILIKKAPKTPRRTWEKINIEILIRKLLTALSPNLDRKEL